VPPWRARRHLLWLSRRGVGRDAVAEACDVAAVSIKRIRQGRRRFILRETERRILAVDLGAVAGGGLRDAAPTWRKLAILLSEGFTRSELARRLGYAKPELRMGRARITAATAMRVDRFYARIMAGGEPERRER
jgi:hypothetical protein